jgi:hypothetical protein
VPDENLAFNLLNEPEFEQMKAWNKREIWQGWATEMVDVIRDISPQRTIIIEGIHKSLFAQNNGPANVIRPIPRKNIVYGFHYYQDEEWGRQDRDHLKGVSGVPLPSLNNLKSNMQQLVAYTKNYKVPVVLTEIGVNGPCDGNGPLQKDRATYFSVVYEMLVANSIGITWWALETADGPPYQRISGDCYSDLYEKQLIPDKQLFKALRLTPVTTEAKQPSKAVVDALQIILDNEEAEKKAKEHTIFDGRYSFTISRYNEDEGSKRLGNGYIEINNGIMTVAKEGRTLDTGSIDLYDSFEGQIDKKGNIMSSLKITVLSGVDSPPLFLVDLNGSIDSPLQGEWDHYFDVILELEFKKNAKEHTLFDGRYPFTLSRHHEDEGSKRLGNGYIEINNGIMTVAKEGRTLDTGSIDLYDSFEGQIDKQGNIISGSLNINIMFGEEGSNIVSLKGNKDSQFEGAWNNDWDVILRLGKKE